MCVYIYIYTHAGRQCQYHIHVHVKRCHIHAISCYVYIGLYIIGDPKKIKQFPDRGPMTRFSRCPTFLYMFCVCYIPSGELTFCHGTSPCLMGKSTISMAIFHCYVSSPEGTHIKIIWEAFGVLTVVLAAPATRADAADEHSTSEDVPEMLGNPWGKQWETEENW